MDRVISLLAMPFIAHQHDTGAMQLLIWQQDMQAVYCKHGQNTFHCTLGQSMGATENCCFATKRNISESASLH